MAVYQSTRASQRVGPLRSRRGCKTCKIRKIKCGEEKPSCQRCIASKYKCEYDKPTTCTYSSAPSTTSILDLPVSTFPNTVWRERRAFAYYFQHAAPYLSGGMDRDFWVSVVPQICRTEPALWDAVNAISTLFENPKICIDFVFLSLRHKKPPAPNPTQSQALGWYSRSLSKIRAQIDRGSVDAQVALISSVLFMCIETLQGHVEDALQLFHQGIKLILDLRATKTSHNILIERTIVPLFIRLGTAALTLSGVPVCDLFKDLETDGEYSFASLKSARDALVSLAAEALVLERESGSNPFIDVYPEATPVMVARQNHLHHRLDQWYRAYTSLTEASQGKGHSPSNLDTGPNALLLAFHTTLTMIVSTCFKRLESVYDGYLPSFRIVVEQAGVALDCSASPDGTQPAFTFELGVGLPLYYTALHCRNPSLRRNALELLQKAPPMQGFHKCAPGIMIARKIMHLEEEFAKDILRDSVAQQPTNNPLLTPPYDDADVDTSEIPDEARIQHYAFFRPRESPALVGPHDIAKWKRGPDQIFLRFTRNRRDKVDEAVWRLTDELVPMDLDLDLT
ncbi:hypothetical protein BDV12DRAFT_9739 [Aspergillus spectabilis]